jgi:REP element-mobilizing transposase RayT
VRPVLRVGMPPAPRLVAPGGTMHVVARRNNRLRTFRSSNFGLRMYRRSGRSDERRARVAYTLMANHVHLLVQAPIKGALGRSLRWFLTQTAKAFHKVRGRRTQGSIGETLTRDTVEAAPESQEKTREGKWDCSASHPPEAEWSDIPGRGFRHALLTRWEALWARFSPILGKEGSP